MKSKIKITLTLSFMVLFPIIAKSQVSTGEKPISFSICFTKKTYFYFLYNVVFNILII